jgi:hypothetical protein
MTEFEYKETLNYLIENKLDSFVEPTKKILKEKKGSSVVDSYLSKEGISLDDSYKIFQVGFYLKQIEDNEVEDILRIFSLLGEGKTEMEIQSLYSYKYENEKINEFIIIAKKQITNSNKIIEEENKRKLWPSLIALCILIYFFVFVVTEPGYYGIMQIRKIKSIVILIFGLFGAYYFLRDKFNR